MRTEVGFPDLPLGKRMHSFGVVLRGGLSDQRWVTFLRDVARAIGMTAIDEPAVWSYPLDGKGGEGQTIILPITESFLALDTWRDHRGAYLFVCSCREFEASDIDRVAISYGLTPTIGQDGRFNAELSLT